MNIQNKQTLHSWNTEGIYSLGAVAAVLPGAGCVNMLRVYRTSQAVFGILEAASVTSREALQCGALQKTLEQET